jgi:hypothetical protein
MTPTRKTYGLGWVAAAGALTLAVAWSLLCPWLIALPAAQAATLVPVHVVGALMVGLFAFRQARSAATLGPRGAVHLGGVVALAGTVASLASGLALLRSLGAAEAVAQMLAAGGVTLSVALVVMLLASWRSHHRGDETVGRSVPLRALLAGAAGLLATSAWALASGHVLGQLHADAERHAVDEARDVCAIVAERALISEEVDAIVPILAPNDGWLVSLDDDGHVVAGVGATPGSKVAMLGGDVCHAVGSRALPCSVRRLVDGTIIAAAVPAVPIARGVVLGFTLAGLLVALTALAIGALIGGGTARDLSRVAQTLDELGRSPRGLDRPVVAWPIIRPRSRRRRRPIIRAPNS